MKTMKKIFALTLAMMMVFSLALSANADTPTGTVVIDNAAAGETYTFYRVYDLESVKVDADKVSPIYITNTTWGTFVVDDYMTITTDGHVTVKAGLTEADAQTIAAAVVTENKTEDKTITATASGTMEVTGLQYGYYVMKSDRTNNAPRYTVFTLSGTTPLHINEKNANDDLPEIEKTVLEDSTNAFGETNDADIGQIMTFKLKITATAGTDAYTITDTMPKMQLLSITSVTRNGNTITEGFTIDPTTGSDSFTVTFTNAFRNSLVDGDVIEITYTAKLTNNAVIDGAGNLNNVVLQYGVEGDDGMKPTKEDSTTTKTYQITVNKTGDKGAALQGATFVLAKPIATEGEETTYEYYKYDETNGVSWVTDKTQATPATSNANGVLTFVGIDADTYTLVETDAPDGYVLPTAGQGVTITNTNVTTTVTNVLGEKLPETGGMGTTLFYAVGGLMVAAAAVLMVLKKRQNAM